MNIEKVEFDHFKNIEELIKHLEMWYAEDDYYAYDRYFGLRDARIMGMYIYQLQQENQQLKDKINKATEYIENKIESDLIPQYISYENGEETEHNYYVNAYDLLNLLKEDNKEGNNGSI